MSASASVNRSTATASVPQATSAGLDHCKKRLNELAQKVFNEIPPPEEYKCSITYAIMKDPSQIPCGHAFDFEQITQWLNTTRSCPFCRKPSVTSEVKKNPALKALITTWQAQEHVPSLSHFTEENSILAQQHFDKAHSCLQKEEYEKALEAFGDACKYTKRSEDYAVIPAIYEKRQETDKATLSYLYLAFYQLNEGKVLEALKTLEYIKEMNPALPLNSIIVSLEFLKPRPDLNMIMKVASGEKDKEEAIAIYKQVITHIPGCFEAYQHLEPLLRDLEEKRALMLQAAEIAERFEDFALAAQFREKAKISYIETVISAEQWANAARLQPQLPPYPPELQDFLAQPCTIWEGKTRAETHIVVPLFPRVSINGVEKPMTLESLEQLNSSSGGPGYYWLWDDIDKNISAEEEFHWAVMTKDVLPGSRNKPYEEQRALLPAGYEVPGVFDAVRATLWEHRRSGIYYFGVEPRPEPESALVTITRCKEIFAGYRVGVGGFGLEGLYVLHYNFVDEEIGIAGFRKF